MSRTGKSYSSAAAERFFHAMKVKLIHGERFTDRELLKPAVVDDIEVDYNRARRQSALGYVSQA